LFYLEIIIVYKWWLLVAVAVAAFLINVDYTAVNLILIPIADEYGATLSSVKWLLTAYVLFWALFILPSGRASDVFGHKKLAIGGLAVFLVSSVIAAYANSMSMLILARILQGLGGALFVPSLYTRHGVVFATRVSSSSASCRFQEKILSLHSQLCCLKDRDLSDLQ
jgi:MFS family permease